MVVGRDDLARIEPGAAAYVMPGVERQTPRGLQVRLIRAPRVFSLETAREVLEFLLQDNLDVVGGA